MVLGARLRIFMSPASRRVIGSSCFSCGLIVGLQVVLKNKGDFMVLTKRQSASPTTVLIGPCWMPCFGPNRTRGRPGWAWSERLARPTAHQAEAPIIRPHVHAVQ